MTVALSRATEKIIVCQALDKARRGNVATIKEKEREDFFRQLHFEMFSWSFKAGPFAKVCGARTRERLFNAKSIQMV